MTTRKIRRSTYLQAFGLFTMAHRRSREADAFAAELGKLLGTDAMSHLNDAIYSTADDEDFDDALRREGIQVEDGAP